MQCNDNTCLKKNKPIPPFEKNGFVFSDFSFWLPISFCLVDSSNHLLPKLK